MVLAKLTISGGIVAEKKSDCLFLGSTANSFLTSCTNPMSSILSASSSTNISTSLIFKYPWFIKSSNRPGVAMTTSTPFFNAVTCGPCPTPPKITVQFKPVCLPYALKLSPICMASSLVGVTIKLLIFFLLSCVLLLTNNCKIGSVKAAVLPVPV